MQASRSTWSEQPRTGLAFACHHEPAFVLVRNDNCGVFNLVLMKLDLIGGPIDLLGDDSGRCSRWSSAAPPAAALPDDHAAAQASCPTPRCSWSFTRDLPSGASQAGPPPRVTRQHPHDYAPRSDHLDGDAGGLQVPHGGGVGGLVGDDHVDPARRADAGERAATQLVTRGDDYHSLGALHHE